MSVKKLVSTRNLFVNTDDAPDSDGVRARYNLPTGVIDCESNQTMTLTLSSFNMRKGFYSVNQTNNVFYILNNVQEIDTSTNPHSLKPSDTIKATRCVIEPGNYRLFWTDDDNLNGEYTNWIATETNPRPPAIKEATLGTAIKAAILNSETNDITMTKTGDKFTYTSVASKPAFSGPNTISLTEAASAVKTGLGQDITNAVPDAITVTWSATKGIFEIVFREVSTTAGLLKFAVFYVKSFVPDASKLNIYEQIITTPGGTRDDLDLFQSTFEILGGCGEIRERPIGTTVTEQFNNLQPLFTKEAQATVAEGRIVSIDGKPGNAKVILSGNLPNPLPPTQFFGFIEADLVATNQMQSPIANGNIGDYVMIALWINNGTDAYFATEHIYLLDGNFGSSNIVPFISPNPPTPPSYPAPLFPIEIPFSADLFPSARSLSNLNNRPFIANPLPGASFSPANSTPQLVVKVSNTQVQAFRGQYKAALEVNESIFVRTNLPSKNYQTLGFDTSIAQSPEVQPSQILAKIPLNEPADLQQYVIEEKIIDVALGNQTKIENGQGGGAAATNEFQIPKNTKIRVGDMIVPQNAILNDQVEPTTFTTDFPAGTTITKIDYEPNTEFYKITTSANNTGNIQPGGTIKLLIKQFTIYRNQIPYEFINYEDNGNGLYSLDLTTPHVSQLEIFLTDSFGRLLPFTSEEQARCKALSFSCDLRIDTYEEVITRTIEVGMKK